MSKSPSSNPLPEKFKFIPVERRNASYFFIAGAGNGLSPVGLVRLFFRLLSPNFHCGLVTLNGEMDLGQIGSGYGYPDSNVHGANMGPSWVLSAPDGPHVGPMNLAIRVAAWPHPRSLYLVQFRLITNRVLYSSKTNSTWSAQVNNL